jgi:carbon-monoxide dehydrogenase small subunit
VRAAAAEELLAAEAPWDSAEELDAGFAARVGTLVAEATRPRSDGRGSESYKRHAAAVLGARALRRAWRGRSNGSFDGRDTTSPSRVAEPHPAATWLTLGVDGAEYELPEETAGHSLLRVLRDDLGITAPKNACEEGECGSCTVAIDGETACACLVPAAQAAGCEVETAAGLAAPDGALHPVQEAFLEAGGVQCGFCTPGFMMAARDLLRRVPDPTVEEIREGLNGNLCRCTGYAKIVAAVRLAAER